ncbi:amidohydrolase [Neptunicella marina]|uniref:Amidohydrolase n=1 Tax=Neptunicella marina TaxID=2125989 RepID=A0A8J6M0T9_9ALTE|nr:amidohydrolase [Neptunicella marina]MBC3767705.1 amidohydrolase [Neptunicella marina]
MKKFNTVLAIGAALLSAAPQAMAADLIYNFKGYGFEPDRSLVSFNTMLVENGKVLDRGNADLLKKYPDASRQDMQGKTILPGLIDAHGHFMGLGQSLLAVDVRDIRSEQQTVAKTLQFAEVHPELEWVTGRGWNQVLWPDKQFPSKTSLDEFISNRPVVLERIDGHAVWANSLALKKAGISKDTLDPPGGQLLRDASGEPTGVLIDNAMDILREHMPADTPQQLQQQFDAAQQHLLELGITSMHDAGTEKAAYDFYLDALEQRKFKMRIYAMLAGWDAQFKSMLDKGFITDPEDMLSIRSVKLVADGALGSRGAALLKPYDDDPHNNGLMVTSEKQLSELLPELVKRDYQVNIHAIGDKANHVALNQFAAVRDVSKARHLRHRIEHAQIIALEDIPRFKSLDIIASMQPTHATSDKNMAGDRIGEQRLAGAYAWQTLLKQGTLIAAGSDFPVELANPFYGIHAAVTRQDRDNQPPGGWRPQEKMTLEQALRAFTIDAAYAGYQEKVIGGLSKNQWADFVVIDRDIFAIPEQDLWKVQVLQTWVAGKQQYNKAL